jgi:hypothetical protein
LKGDLKQRAWIEGEKSGHIEQSIRRRTPYDFVEYAGSSLLVAAINCESAGDTARTGRHHSFHQNIAIDRAGAAKLAAFDIHNGAAGCGERAIHDRASAGLRVICARGEKARVGYRHGAEVRKCSGVVERASVHEMGARIENAFVGQGAEVIEVRAGRVVDRASVVKRAGNSVGNCAVGGIVYHAGVSEESRAVRRARNVQCASVIECARVGDGDGAASCAAIVQIDLAFVIQRAGVRKAAGIEDQAQADRSTVVERAGVGKAAWVELRRDTHRAFIAECPSVEKPQAVSSDRAGIDKGSACVVAEAGVPDE